VAVFGSLNKRYVELGEPIAVTGLELAAGTDLPDAAGAGLAAT
jgi:hypothetical protein